MLTTYSFTPPAVLHWTLMGHQ